MNNPGYIHVKTLIDDYKSTVYTAIREQDKRRVLVKTRKDKGGAVFLKREYDILKGSAIKSAIPVLAFETDASGARLVFEEFTGQTLLRHADGKKPSMREFLFLALALTRAVALIHENGVIHRDIAPENILINAAGVLRVIEFSAAIKQGERAEISAPVGSLAYMPPEQTGRVDMPVSFASDLYALGMTLYHIATGRAPFSQNATVPLIHAQIALYPQRPDEVASVHPVVSDIIMKLIQKSPNERYGSAKSLEGDLAACLNQIKCGGALFKFPLDTAFCRLVPNEALIGKGAELDICKNVLSGVISARSAFITAIGPKNCGKTVFLREFERFAVSRGAFCVFLELSASHKPEPYAALNAAVLICRENMLKSGADALSLKNAIVDALGADAAVLSQILPALSFMREAGEGAPVLKNISYNEEMHRRSYVFNAFLRVVAGKFKSVAFIIDNLAFADKQSLQLLAGALSDPEIKNFLCVVSYRLGDAEIEKTVNDTFLTEKIAVTKVMLNYLSVEETAVFLEELLGLSDGRKRALELSEQIIDVSNGRPRAAIEYINRLANEKLLALNGEKGSYEWDINAIKSLKLKPRAANYENVKSALTQSERDALNICAVYGTVADRLELFAEERVINALAEKNILKITKANNETTGAFYDAGFRAYLLSGVAPRAANDIRLNIARRLLEAYAGTDAIKTKAPVIAEFLNAALELLSENEKTTAVNINALAGDDCFYGANAADAIVFYDTGLNVFGGGLFESDYPLAVKMSVNCAAACLANESDEVFERVSKRFLENVKTEADRFHYYEVIINSFTCAERHDRAAAFAAEYLKGGGLLYEERVNPGETLKNCEEKLRKYLLKNTLNEMADMPMSDNPAALRRGAVLAKLSDALWSLGDGKAPYYHFLAFAYAIENGAFDNFELLFYNDALACVKKGEYKKAEEFILLCIDRAEKTNAPKTRALIRYGAQISHWLYPAEETFKIYKKAKAAAEKEGLGLESGKADLMAIDAAFFISASPKSALPEIELSIQNIKTASDSAARILKGVMRPFAKCLMGRTNSPSVFSDQTFDEAAFASEAAGDRLVLYYYNAYKSIALAFNACYAEAIARAESAQALSGAQSGGVLSVAVSFTCVIASLRGPVSGPALSQGAAARQNMRALEGFAKENPENFKMWFLCAELAEAAARRDAEKTIKAYARVEKAADGFKNGAVLAFINETMSDFWEAAGNLEYAAPHLFKAAEIYASSGFNARLGAMSDKLLKYKARRGVKRFEGEKPFETAVAENALNIIAQLRYALDVATLSDKLLRALSTHCGASKGFCVTVRNGAAFIEAVTYAKARSGNISANLLPVPLLKADEYTFPSEIVKNVLEKKEGFCANSFNEARLLTDVAYTQINLPESVLCAPIFGRDGVIGVIYLENTDLAGVFGQALLSLAQTVLNNVGACFQNAVYCDELNNYANTVQTRLKEHTGRLNSLMAGVAHEINTPVGVCLTVVSHIGRQTKTVSEKFAAAALSKSELENYFEEMKRGSRLAAANMARAAELVQNFKNVSLGQADERFENINLYTALCNTVEFIRPAVKKNVADIAVTGDSKFTFYSCPGALSQIITNLIMNSSVHGFENKPKNACAINIAFTHNASGVTIIYADNGKGMTKSEAEKLFDPFFTTKRGAGGSGLGGHIIHTLVTDTLNGRITCDSAPGKGAVFTITLPVAAIP